MNDKTSYPLCWPDGWPRTAAHKRAQSRFQRSVAYGSNRFHSMDDACGLLAAEIDRIGGSDAVLSTNVRVRLDGKPYSNQAQPNDTGAAVYFKLKGKPVSLACDKWKRVECNVYAIAKHVEALRGQERWGVGSVEQAFRGYMALPAIGQTSGDNPWHVLGVAVNASEEQITEAFRLLAKKWHPDNPQTGDAEQFTRLRAAHDLLMQSARKAAR